MLEKTYEVKPKEPKILPPGYTQGIDNMTPDDFLKIYIETLKYQDPFQQQDLSKMLDDMVKLNQVRHFNDIRTFLEGLKGWFNQMTFMSGLTLIGKEAVFATETLDTLRSGEYFLLSNGNYNNVTVKVMDGEEVVKEMKVNLGKGLNTLDIPGLPPGQYTLKFYKDGLELSGLILGVKGVIKSASVIGQSLMFELENGLLLDSSKIVHVGG